MAQRNVEAEKQAAQTLLQRPEYAGVLDLEYGDPAKTKFFSELTQMAYGKADPIFTAAPGQHQPVVSALGGGSTEQLQQFYSSAIRGATIPAGAPAGPPAGAPVAPGGAPPTEEEKYKTSLSEAQKGYMGHLTKAPTFESEYRAGLKEEGYDLEASYENISAKRSELMRATTEGTFETRDYEKVGRIGADMLGMIATHKKRALEVESKTQAALDFFVATGVMKEKEVTMAKEGLKRYMDEQKEKWDKEMDIAQLTGYFLGKPTLARQKAFKPTGDGTAATQDWEKDMAVDYQKYLDDPENVPSPFKGMTTKETTRLKKVHAQWRGSYDDNIKRAKEDFEKYSGDELNEVRDYWLKELENEYGSAFGEVATQLGMKKTFWTQAPYWPK